MENENMTREEYVEYSKNINQYIVKKLNKE